MPKESYEELLTPMTDITEASAEPSLQVEYDGKNMDAILVILEFLDARLDHTVRDYQATGRLSTVEL